jgi:hypothetical protein
MQLHADLGEVAIVRGKQVTPVPSPAAGVDRRMLERDGDEVGAPGRGVDGQQMWHGLVPTGGPQAPTIGRW